MLEYQRFEKNEHIAERAFFDFRSFRSELIIKGIKRHKKRGSSTHLSSFDQIGTQNFIEITPHIGCYKIYL